MSSDMDRQNLGDRTLTDEQRWSVVRIGALALALVFTVPLYYALVELVPAIEAVVPPIAVHAVMAVGLCVVLPGALVYAHVVANRVESYESDDQRAYGVNDHWERQNL